MPSESSALATLDINAMAKAAVRTSARSKRARERIIGVLPLFSPPGMAVGQAIFFLNVVFKFVGWSFYHKCLRKWICARPFLRPAGRQYAPQKRPRQFPAAALRTG